MGEKTLRALSTLRVFVVFIVILVVRYLGLDLKGVFYSAKKHKHDSFAFNSSEIQNEPTHENISKAIEQKKYAEAVRLLYLQSLHQLNISGKIEIKHYKTNHDYMYEIANTQYYPEFQFLTLCYENVCYGQIQPDETTFRLIHDFFKRFLNSI